MTLCWFCVAITLWGTGVWLSFFRKLLALLAPPLHPSGGLQAKEIKMRHADQSEGEGEKTEHSCHRQQSQLRQSRALADGQLRCQSGEGGGAVCPAGTRGWKDSRSSHAKSSDFFRIYFPFLLFHWTNSKIELVKSHHVKAVSQRRGCSGDIWKDSSLRRRGIQIMMWVSSSRAISGMLF